MTMSESPEKPELEIRFGRRRHIRGRPAPEVIFVETDTHTLSLQISKYSDLHFVSGFFGTKTAGGIVFLLLTNIMSAPALGKSATAQTTGDRQIRQTGTMRWPTNLSCRLSLFGEVQFVIDDFITQDATGKPPREEVVDIFKLLGNSQLWFDHVQKKRSRHDGTTVDLEKSCKIIQSSLQ